MHVAHDLFLKSINPDRSVSGRQDALGGNSKTVVVANVAPGAGSVRETLSTLGFAQRAKQARPPSQL